MAASTEIEMGKCEHCRGRDAAPVTIRIHDSQIQCCLCVSCTIEIAHVIRDFANRAITTGGE